MLFDQKEGIGFIQSVEPALLEANAEWKKLDKAATLFRIPVVYKPIDKLVKRETDKVRQAGQYGSKDLSSYWSKGPRLYYSVKGLATDTYTGVTNLS